MRLCFRAKPIYSKGIAFSDAQRSCLRPGPLRSGSPNAALRGGQAARGGLPGGHGLSWSTPGRQISFLAKRLVTKDRHLQAGGAAAADGAGTHHRLRSRLRSASGIPRGQAAPGCQQLDNRPPETVANGSPFSLGSNSCLCSQRPFP